MKHQLQICNTWSTSQAINSLYVFPIFKETISSLILHMERRDKEVKEGYSM